MELKLVAPKHRQAEGRCILTRLKCRTHCANVVCNVYAVAATRLKLLDWTQVSDPECTQLEAAVSKTGSHMFKCNHVGMIKLYTFYVAFYTFHWLKCPKLH